MHRVLSMAIFWMQWQPSTLVLSSFHFPIQSNSLSALSLMPLHTPKAGSSSHLVHHSRSNSSKASPCIQVKETTCTSSLVRCHDNSLTFMYLLSHRTCIGLGLAAILGRVSEITDSMVEASSLGLANSLTNEERSLGLLYPRIERS